MRRPWRRLGVLSCAVILGGLGVLGAQAQPAAAGEPLPEPLSLAAAIALAMEPDPQLELIEAGLLDQQAQRQSTESRFDTKVSLQLQAQWIGPSRLAADPSSEDHRIALQADRLLYDFGRGAAESAASEALVRSQRWRLVSARDERRLRIMERYFDVLLADLRSMAVVENMTVAYLRYDRLRERNLLGQVSDVRLLEAEAQYQSLVVERDQAQVEQRRSRAALAIALNRPDELSNSLLEPEVWSWEWAVPDYASLLQLALESNPRLHAAQAAADAARNELSAARAADRPKLSASAEVADYARIESGSDEWRVTLQLDVPIYSGRRRSAGIMQARAATLRANARLRAIEMDIRQSLLDTWQGLNVLSARRDAVYAQQDYRDLYLDRSRALYELERQSDLGDAMARFSEARVASAEVNYALMLTWENLRALLGIEPGPNWHQALPAAAASEG